MWICDHLIAFNTQKMEANLAILAMLDAGSHRSNNYLDVTGQSREAIRNCIAGLEESNAFLCRFRAGVAGRGASQAASA
jgi:hypothetical protein